MVGLVDGRLRPQRRAASSMQLAARRNRAARARGRALPRAKTMGWAIIVLQVSGLARVALTLMGRGDSDRNPRFRRPVAAARGKASSHGAAHSLRRSRRLDLAERRDGAVAGGEGPRADPWPALWQLRVRGRALLRRPDLQEHRAQPAADRQRPHPGLRGALLGGRARCRDQGGHRRQERASRTATSARSPGAAPSRWASPPSSRGSTSRSRSGNGAPTTATSG